MKKLFKNASVALLFVTACRSSTNKGIESETQSKIRMTPIEVHGHRGARALRPENTLAAFEYALSVGVDVLELDLGVTKDGVLVASHDPYLNTQICQGPQGKTLNKKVLLHSLSYGALKEYDCGALKNPRFERQLVVPGEPMPRLRDIFSLVKKSKLAAAKNVRFNIETKIDPRSPADTVSPEDFASLLVYEMLDAGLADRIVVQSFDFRTLALIRKRLPNQQISLLFEGAFGRDYIEELKKYKANVFSPKFSILNSELVAKVQQMGVKVIPWTLNDANDWQSAIDMGVDGIISDDPEALIAWLKDKKLRNYLSRGQ